MYIQTGRANGKTEMFKQLEKQIMSIPNNSILKDGKVKGGAK